MASSFAAVRWVLFSSFGFRFLSLGGQMLILRVVDKDTFGAYRAIVLIHMIFLMALPLSFDTLVVREKLRKARYIVALSNALALVGAAAAVGALVLAIVPAANANSFLSRLLQMGEDYPALYFMPPVFLAMSLKLSIRAVHTADLNFKKISIGEFGNGIITWIGGAGAILLAPYSWALMAAYLAGECFECYWMYRHERMRFPAILKPRRWSVLARLWKKHKSYCLFNSGNLTFSNIGSLLPGVLIVALISKEANADLQVAMQLLVLPTMLLSGALWRVAFPSLSGVPEKELQSRSLKIVGGTSAFIAPSVLWFAWFAPTTAYILGGEKYLGTVPPLVHWMAIYMILSAVYSPISSIDMIRDRPDLGLYWNLAHTVGRVLVIYWLAGDGLLATLAGMSIFSFVMWVIHIWIIGWLLGAGWRRFLRPTWRYVPLWVLLGAGFAGCHWLAKGHLAWGPALSIVPGLVYIGLVYKLFPGEGALIGKLLKR